MDVRTVRKWDESRVLNTAEMLPLMQALAQFLRTCRVDPSYWHRLEIDFLVTSDGALCDVLELRERPCPDGHWKLIFSLRPSG
jgi:hypothetical protein